MGRTTVGVVGGVRDLLFIGLLAAATAGCGNSVVGTPDGGGGPPGGGTGEFPPGGTTFPWPVFDNKIPDAPEATGGATTWYADAQNGNDSNNGTSFATAKKTLNAIITGGGLKAGD